MNIKSIKSRAGLVLARGVEKGLRFVLGALSDVVLHPMS